MSNYYHHSGKLSAEGLAIGLLSGVIVAIPASFLYNFALFQIDIIKLRIICPMAFGAVIGLACGWPLCLGRVRNRIWAGVAAGSAAIVGLYLSWAAWLLHLIEPSRWIFNLVSPALHPRGLWSAILAVNATGTWGQEANQPTTGVSLWIIWVFEALLVMGFSVLTSTEMVQRRPFCERCDEWCTERRSVYFEPTIAPGQFKAMLETKDISQIAKLSAGSKKKAHYRLDLRTCGTCSSLNTLSLIQNFPRDRKTLVNKLIASSEQAELFRAIQAQQSATTSTAAVPAP